MGVPLSERLHSLPLTPRAALVRACSPSRMLPSPLLFRSLPCFFPSILTSVADAGAVEVGARFRSGQGWHTKSTSPDSAGCHGVPLHGVIVSFYGAVRLSLCRFPSGISFMAGNQQKMGGECSVFSSLTAGAKTKQKNKKQLTWLSHFRY